MDDSELKAAYDTLKGEHEALQRQYRAFEHILATPHLELKLAIFDRFPMPIWACDRECKIVFWSKGAARTYGYTSEEAVGRDFVELFVNGPEKDKARADCRKIIDENQPIKNMADDIDKHGNTQTLVTHCFPIYNVDGHSGLQVEVSYEAQDYERLRSQLLELQESSRRKQEEIEELGKKLIAETRQRALDALASQVSSARERLAERLSNADKASYVKGADMAAISKVKSEVTASRNVLLAWERKMRSRVLSNLTGDELDELIVQIENGADLNV